jgi:hypothetical protein
MRIRYIFMRSASLYNIFPQYLTNGKILEKKGHWTQNVCFDLLYNFWREVPTWCKNFVLLSQISLHVSGIYMPIFRSTGLYTTAYGVQHSKRELR